MMSLRAIINGVHFITDLKESLESCERLFELSENHEMIRDESKLINVTDLGNIEFKNIEFRYNENAKVFNNLNLTIHKNKFNALVGYSGGGKSTILNLLLKLYQPQSGEIYINGTNLEEINSESILDLVGYVGQDSIVFDDTIEENLQVGLRDKINQNEINNLMMKVNSSDF